jgi:uncharacterized membrane protein
MVPREDVHDLDMSIPDAMKLIISGGAVVPPWNPGAVKKESSPGLPGKPTSQPD